MSWRESDRDDSWTQPGSPKAVSRSTGSSVGSGAAEDSVEGEDSSSQESGPRERRDDGGQIAGLGCRWAQAGQIGL